MCLSCQQARDGRNGLLCPGTAVTIHLVVVQGQQDRVATAHDAVGTKLYGTMAAKSPLHSSFGTIQRSAACGVPTGRAVSSLFAAPEIAVRKFHTKGHSRLTVFITYTAQIPRGCWSPAAPNIQQVHEFRLKNPLHSCQSFELFHTPSSI
jgi:hypothetical protein